MADERNAEIVNEPRKYTARQVFESAAEWVGATLRGTLDAAGNTITDVSELHFDDGGGTRIRAENNNDRLIFSAGGEDYFRADKAGGNDEIDFHKVSNFEEPIYRDGAIFLTEVSVNGQEQLSSGSATVDTEVSTSETATFYVALGPNTDDADIAAEVRADSGTGTYVVDLVETADTSVGNPIVEYDVIRVR